MSHYKFVFDWNPEYEEYSLVGEIIKAPLYKYDKNNKKAVIRGSSWAMEEIHQIGFSEFLFGSYNHAWQAPEGRYVAEGDLISHYSNGPDEEDFDLEITCDIIPANRKTRKAVIAAGFNPDNMEIRL